MIIISKLVLFFEFNNNFYINTEYKSTILYIKKLIFFLLINILFLINIAFNNYNILF